MWITNLISRVMMLLAPLPGLGFLQTYVQAAKGMQTRFGQRKGDYEAYLQAGRAAAEEVSEEVGSDGPRTEAGGGDGAHNEDDLYEYDYEYDDSDISSDSVDMMIEDDYPVSDEYNTYYDDHYGSR